MGCPVAGTVIDVERAIEKDVNHHTEKYARFDPEFARLRSKIIEAQHELIAYARKRLEAKEGV